MTVPSKHLVLLFTSLALVAIVLGQGPISQDRSYHVFADSRTVLGVANGWNVLSNALFIIVGLAGTVITFRRRKNAGDRDLLLQYGLFFAGVFLTGIGSCYYHLAPSNERLLWDRLPMSVAFMALLASVLSECIDRRLGSLLLPLLVALGLTSVLYWAWTEQGGQGDLRPYVIVQFLPVVLIPLILILFRPAGDYASAIWTLVALYVIGKLFEVFDRQVFAALTFISGHTIKHIVAALGTAAVLRMVYVRRTKLTA